MLRVLAAVTAVVCVLLTGAAGLAGRTVAAEPHQGWTRPIAGASITQRFGCTTARFEPVDRACHGGHWHAGIDLAAAAGTPVRAVLPGVAQVEWSAFGYGLHVVIDHGGGLTTLYGHLQSVAVATGSAVDEGQVLGAVGSSGNSTGPHLHFEVRRDGVAEDPLLDVELP